VNRSAIGSRNSHLTRALQARLDLQTAGLRLVLAAITSPRVLGHSARCSMARILISR